jgi:ribosome-associated protein
MGIVEHFVVTSASNTRQVKTIVDEVEKQMRERADAKPRAVEGLSDASWVLVDYGDIVVHVFFTDTREFYGLERLWSDVPRVAWEGVGAA